jgi:predicted dehydrogenase
MRIAVVGAGVMGTNHGRVASTLPDAALTHVIDADHERAASLANAYGVESGTDPMSIVGNADAAILALPTALHTPVAVPLLEAGVHCLVEKPIAGSVEDAEKILAAAESSGATLMVGHVERFNPAVLELDRVLDERVIHIEAARVGPFSARVKDSVVLDLMIHDLDLARSIAGGEVVKVSALAQRTRTDSEDLTVALLTFDNGVTATVTASRLGQQKTRELRITQEDSFVVVELMGPAVTLHRVEHAEFTGKEGTVYRQRGLVEIPMLETRGEPLWLEQREFVAAIREGRAPRVSGEDGLAALKMALDVVSACSEA